jgi:hypothetical protein
MKVDVMVKSENDVEFPEQTGLIAHEGMGMQVPQTSGECRVECDQ